MTDWERIEARASETLQGIGELHKAAIESLAQVLHDSRWPSIRFNPEGCASCFDQARTVWDAGWRPASDLAAVVERLPTVERDPKLRDRSARDIAIGYEMARKDMRRLFAEWEAKE